MTAALLRQLLWATFDVVGEVSDGYALVEAAKRLKPDVIVTDITHARAGRHRSRPPHSGDGRHRAQSCS